LDGKPEGKIRLEDLNVDACVEMDLKEIGWESVD